MRLKERTRTARASGTAPLPALGLDNGTTPFLPEAVQSNVVRSVNPQQARYIFFQIADPDAFRRFIGKLLNPPEGRPGEPDGDFFDLPSDMRKLWSEGFAHKYDELVTAQTFADAFPVNGRTSLV